MILYVNGDSHTAAAEAVTNHAFAEDDSRYFYMGRAPHPANLAVSWGRLLADSIKATFKCDAESAASNDRIIRTTRAWLENLQSSVNQLLVMIQWSTWERKEWLIDDTYYQINASGMDTVPESHQERYQEFISGINWNQATTTAHDQIWQFHQELAEKNIQHVFFNGNNDFSKIPLEKRQDWAQSYISPYDSQMTYHQWLQNNGFQTVSPRSWHYGRDAHSAWHRFVLQYIIKNQLI